MSDLLEQAIIDATALKEAAIKNAENALIEKYSQEFKDTVQRLLEQEQLAAPVADPTMQAAPVAGEEDPLNVIPAAFADADDDELVTIDFKGIKKALNEMMGIQEEEVEEEAYDNRGNWQPGMDGGSQSLTKGHEIEEMELQEEDEDGDSEEQPSMEEELELEGFELEEEVIEEENLTDTSSATAGTSADANVAMDKKASSDMAQKSAEGDADVAQKQADFLAAQKTLEAKKEALRLAKIADEQAKQQSALEEEQMQISEEELMELAEELRIDLNIEAQGRGYMGSTTTEKRLQRNVELAAARDEVNTEAREEEMEKMADLVKENTDLSNKVKELSAFNEEMVTVLQSLKEHVEQMNISNAKLLYTNKALVNISLNERQKNQIVESISKAGSVLEAKTVYETLQSAVESVEKQDKAPKSLSEALNRAQTPFVVRKTPANSINDMQAQRMKLLAGIKSTK